ncbi:hypothetical protein C8J57DRAFT_1308171 [Mycena rebaudengoi]|nr:hypothetical protein C8J57DRAFT_1331830 [Mycena rebaudengoi]KAJ7277894.1 hypothetical protein C8J57DRAFT_1308171 [Mycena rebaudengoi]
MRIPQELVNAIIDSSAQDLQETWSYWAHIEPPEAATLRACALVSHSFSSRSRMHLFASINCWNEDRLRKFGRLLLESPHIGPLYVRHFCLRLTSAVLEGLAHTLLFLTKLTQFELISDYHHPLDGIRTPFLKDALLDIFSSHSLRSLAFSSHGFRDTAAFNALLNQATGLEELCLDRIGFSHTTPGLNATAPVIIRHLRLTNMHINDIEIMLSVLDITRVRSLDLGNTPILPILKANVKHLRSIRCCQTNALYQRIVDQDILEGNRSLQSIEIVDTPKVMVVALEDFGDLKHLKALKTISLDVIRNELSAKNEANSWSRLDSILANVDGVLQNVHIYFYETERRESPDIEILKRWLPSVAGKISLHTSVDQPPSARKFRDGS